MKHLFTSLLSFALVIFVLSSCTKKDDEAQTTTTQSNSFKIGSTEYTIGNLVLINYGPDLYPNDDWDHEGSNIDMILTTKDISWSIVDGTYEPQGSGSYLYFEAFATSETGLPSGTYNYSTAATFPVLTFDYADYDLSYDSSDTTDTESYVEMSSGNFVVKNDNNTYEITINCKDSKGNTVSGYYKGTALFNDVSEMSKAIKSKKISFK